MRLQKHSFHAFLLENFSHFFSLLWEWRHKQWYILVNSILGMKLMFKGTLILYNFRHMCYLFLANVICILRQRFWQWLLNRRQQGAMVLLYIYLHSTKHLAKRTINRQNLVLPMFVKPFALFWSGLTCWEGCLVLICSKVLLALQFSQRLFVESSRGPFWQKGFRLRWPSKKLF